MGHYNESLDYEYRQQQEKDKEECFRVIEEAHLDGEHMRFIVQLLKNRKKLRTLFDLFRNGLQ